MGINNVTELRSAIALLEAEKKINKAKLAEQFHNTYNSLNPVNLIKSAFTKAKDTPGIANKIISTSIGLGAGILSKRILIGSPTNIFKRIFGIIVELAVAGAVTKNADGIKLQGAELIKKLASKLHRDHS